MFGVGDGRVCGEKSLSYFYNSFSYLLAETFFWWIIDPVSSSLDGGVIRYNT